MESVKAILIPVEGEVVLVEQNGLDDLQKFVEGDIESVPYRQDASCYINDQGKLHGMPINRNATALLRKILRPDDVIVGPMIIVGFDESTGDDLDIPDRLRVHLEGAKVVLPYEAV
jgi:hypothetical protein